VINKSNIKTSKPYEHTSVEPNFSMVKDLLVDNIHGHAIYFCNEAIRIAKPNSKDKN
jgi:hypothetical protein